MGDGRADTHDVHQGIKGPDFMEVHGFSTAAMHMSFGFRQGREHSKNSVLEIGIQSCIGNPPADFSPPTVGRIWLEPLHMQPAPTQAFTAIFPDIKANQLTEPKLMKRLLDHVHRHAKVEQPSKKHVSGQTRRTIDM